MKPIGKTSCSADSTRPPPDPRLVLLQIENRCLRELVSAGSRGQRMDSGFMQKALDVFRPGEQKNPRPF